MNELVRIPGGCVNADQTLGELRDSVHVAGYTFERACQRLEYLLQSGAWKECAPGFDDINKFLDSVRLGTELRATAEQRQRIAKLIKEAQPAASNRAIAKTLEVSHDTVNRDVGGRNRPTGEKKPKENKGEKSASGGNRPPAAFPETEPSPDEKPPRKSEPLTGEAVAELGQKLENRVANRTSFTGDNQWFTPAEYVELARSVLGSIDLDPASHELAQKIIKAESFFTEEDDGLKHDWSGNVWLNPPYAQPEIGFFVDKMISEVVSGRVSQAIMLTHNYTDTAWFQKAAMASDVICFTRGRIRFVSPAGELAAPTQGQTFFYFGSRIGEFVEAFSDVGFIVQVRK